MTNQGKFGGAEPSDEDYDEDNESGENSEYYPVKKNKYWSLSNELNQKIKDKGILSVSAEDLANDLDKLYLAIKQNEEIIGERLNSILLDYPALYNLLLSWNKKGLIDYITAVWYSTVDNLFTEVVESPDKEDYSFNIKPNKDLDVLLVELACNFEGCGYWFRLTY